MGNLWLILAGIPVLSFVLSYAHYNQHSLLYGCESRRGYALRWALYRWLILLGGFIYYSLLDIIDCLRGREGVGWTIASIVGRIFEAPWYIDQGARVRYMKRLNDKATQKTRR